MSNKNISLPVAQALASALEKIEAYVPTEYVDNSEPDIDAEHLNHAEQGIMRVTNLLNAAVDVIQGQESRILDAETKIGNAETKIGTAALTGGMTDLSSGVNSLYSNLSISGTTLKNSSYLYGDIEVVKYGKIIQLKLNGLTNITPKTSIIITTLPDGYLPSKAIAWTYTHPLGYIYRISVNNIGQISVYNYSNATQLENIVHTFSFIGQ